MSTVQTASPEPDPVTSHLDCVGDGWHDLLRELHGELVKIAPAYRTAQVKEKFGTLRAYLVPNLPEGPGRSRTEEIFHDIVMGYEERSSFICEWCGAPGSLDTRYHWLLTLCKKCRKRRKREKKEQATRWQKAQEEIQEERDKMSSPSASEEPPTSSP